MKIMMVQIIKKIVDVLHVCISYIKLPLFKKILIGPHFTWFQFNQSLLTAHALLNGFQPIFLKECKNHVKPNQTIALKQCQIKSFRYKGINLFEVTQYQICVDLQSFITELDFSDPTQFKIIETWFCKAAVYIDYVLPLFQKTRFSKAIIMQGYLFDHAIIRWLCIERSIEVIAVENTFNKNRMIWDNVSGLSVNKNLASNYFWRYESSIDIYKAKNYSEEYIKNIKTFKLQEHNSPTTEISIPSKGKTLFFIGQVYTDASTLFGIYDFNSPVSIIESLVEYVIKNRHTLIIKLHPKELDGFDIQGKRYDSLTHKKIMANHELFSIINNHPNIIYDYTNSYDTYSFIKKSDVCITINSQTGLEALLYGKPVITCGNIFYRSLKSTYTAQNKSILYALLDTLLTTDFIQIDWDEIYRFFFIYCEKYCIHKNERSLIALFRKTL